jgi:hypothetical protein
MHLLGWKVRSSGVMIGVFLKVGVKTYLMAPIWTLNWPTLLLSSHL